MQITEKRSAAVIPGTAGETLAERPRVASIDILRGIVMVIMALDHVRDYFHQGAFVYNATDLGTTTPALFFTRWITHFCAPTFVLLAGTSIYISRQRKTANALSVFLLTRGLWLIVLEVVVIRFSFFFNFYFDAIVFQVIWAIGASMICMALLTRLPYKALLGIGALIVVAQNLADLVPLQPEDPFYVPWALLRQAGFVNVGSTTLVIFYPLLPWLGIMILGYCLGKLYEKNIDIAYRRRMLLGLGTATVIGFVILRAINLYGDPAPWAPQENVLYSVMSFINCTKYPVSLLYTLMTLGPVMFMLAWLEKMDTTRLTPFIVFGRVPLFYYVLHFFLIHAVSLLLFMQKTGRSFSQLDFHFSKGFGGITPEGGYSLPWVYVAWISIVLALYPVCRWYYRYKSTHQQWWLSYL